jgi:hypothetical protein
MEREVSRSRSPIGELAFGPKTAKFGFVPQRMTLSSPARKVGLGTIAAALAAFSMAVLGHFVL